jgi:TetR/AcrR family transcriptional regulator, transcriptional repressor for nem operon
MKTSSTKERLFAAGQRLMLDRSFHSVGLNDLLEAVQVPKGSFYHHFESKDQYGVEMLQDYLEQANATRRQILLRSEVEPNPLLRFQAYADALVAKVMQGDGKCPCLEAKLASEVCSLSDGMREALLLEGQETRRIYQAVLDEAVAKNLLPATVPTATWASALVDLLCGAVQRCGITRSVQPLREAIAFLKERLR